MSTSWLVMEAVLKMGGTKEVVLMAKVNMSVVLLMVGLLVLMTKSLVELMAIGVGCGKGCG